MGIFTSVQSFNRGEVAPEFADRSDVEFYQSAVRKLDNWFPIPAGGVTTRPQFDVAKVVSTLTGGGFTVAPATAVLLVQEVKGGTLWMVAAWTYNAGSPQLYKIRARYGLLARTNGVWAAASESVAVDLSVATAAATLFGSAVVNGAGLTSLAKQVTSTAVGPAVFIASKWFPVQRLFIGSGSASLAAVTFYEELIGTVEVASGAATLTGSNTIFSDQLAPADVILIDGTSATIDTVTNDTGATLTANWSGLSLAGLRVTKVKADPFGSGQYPALVTFHKNRLMLFATEGRPTGFWASKPNDPFTIVPGNVYDDAPIEVDLFADGVDEFKWVTSLSQVYLGTSQGEYTISVASDGPLTPSNFSFYRVGVVGGESVPPVPLDGAVVHVARASAQIMASQFDFARQGFTSNDLSLLAPHLLTGEVQSMAYRPPRRNDPAGRFFFVLSDGTIRVFSYNEAQGIQAWGRVTLADGDEQTPLCVSTTSDAVFVLLERDGALVITALDELRDQIWEMDYAETVSPTAPGSNTYNLAALPMLTNRKVAAYSAADGFLGIFDATTTLDLTGLGLALTDVIVGVPYVAEADMLPAVIEQQGTGTSLNRLKRLIRTLVSVLDTYQLNLNELPLFGDVAPTDDGDVRPSSGVFEQRQLGWVKQERSTMSTSGVYRATVLSYTRELSQ